MKPKLKAEIQVNSQSNGTKKVNFSREKTLEERVIELEKIVAKFTSK